MNIDESHQMLLGPHFQADPETKLITIKALLVLLRYPSLGLCKDWHIAACGWRLLKTKDMSALLSEAAGIARWLAWMVRRLGYECIYLI